MKSTFIFFQAIKPDPSYLLNLMHTHEIQAKYSSAVRAAAEFLTALGPAASFCEGAVRPAAVLQVTSLPEPLCTLRL